MSCFTTANHYADWCGIYNAKIRGVADIMAWNKDKLVAGEVKGVSGTQTAAVCQVIAEMQVLATMENTWPVGKCTSRKSFLHNEGKDIEMAPKTK